MNKQEAKQKLHNLAFAKMNNKPDDLKFADVMQIVDQIDEPEKVKLPKYVVKRANFYTSVTGRGLYETMEYLYNFNDTAAWLEGNEKTFARAWLDGFKVEEQKYVVEIPNPESEGQKRFYLGYNDVGKIVIVQRKKVQSFSPLSLTEKDIKRSHAWAWDAGFAKPVEEVKQ